VLVPVVGAEIESDTDWPESIVGEVGVGADGATSAVLILNVLEYPDVTVFVPESVTTTFASSGLFDVSAEVVWNVKASDVAVAPVIRLLCAIVAGVAELTASMLYVKGDTQFDSLAVKLSYCPTSTMALDGEVIDA